MMRVKAHIGFFEGRFLFSYNIGYQQLIKFQRIISLRTGNTCHTNSNAEMQKCAVGKYYLHAVQGCFIK